MYERVFVCMYLGAAPMRNTLVLLDTLISSISVYQNTSPKIDEVIGSTEV